MIGAAEDAAPAANQGACAELSIPRRTAGRPALRRGCATA